ncbi:MAG TPA: iron-containing alcohol dehydrogenase [Verrucomicrobiota bacterium]|nr:iron-containing alcohol dehydrogenase [Verrucomicrobiota bacterium]HNU52384.1 iron-containing alcohol dehydrogenase [Verrucomicrobiota bacterium]
MQNFVYHNPTAILFGRGMIAEVAGRVPVDAPVLMLYGGGSIKRNGVYDQVKAALKAHEVVEFGGIEANPLYETCLRAVEVVRSSQARFLLAVGGGSVLDAAKFIAACACYEGPDPWEILRSHGSVVRAALPLGSVLTLPATGSESNGNSVISRAATREKLALFSRHVFPVFSVLDPETTFSLPPKQVRNGVVDALVHVMEQYMTYPAAAPLQDRLSESILQTLIETGPVTLAEPGDYEARATLVWSATLALNTLLACGVPQDWSTHMIGHELTAFYGLDHAETLAIVLPGVWRHQLESKQAKLEQYGRRVWNVGTAEDAITRTEAFFHSLGMPTRLADYGIDAREAAEKVRARFVERKTVLGERGDLGPEAVARILIARA